MNRTDLYPLLFDTNLHTLVWGTERWEASTIESSPSVIANGPLKGRELPAIVEEYKELLLGDAVSREYKGKMPLFVKFIKANKDLSIQVHPNDALAAERLGKFGKTEMWYIIDAEPGATLYSGFNRKITKEEYKQRVADGTICSCLARHEVHPGDVFYIPAGRVHAIGGGITLAEVQQTSDVTYRIFDYNRPGMDGKPRELHTELASQALDYHVESEYRTIYDENINRANLIVDSPYFSVRVTETPDTFHRNLLKYDSFVITMCIEGDCHIRLRATGEEFLLREGNSVLIPAVLADYDVIPLKLSTRFLDAFIDNMDKSLVGKVTRFLHI